MGTRERFPTAKERAHALMWAVPFLVFFALPLTTIFNKGLHATSSLLLLLACLCLSLTYMSSWVLLPPAPPRPSFSTRYLVCCALILLSQVFFLWATHYHSANGGVYMLTYVVSSAVLLAPQGRAWHAFAAVVVVGIIEIAVFPSETLLPLLTILGTGLFCLLAAKELQADHRRAVEHAQRVELTRERERARISADLHDVLGQTLTGISVKLDLLGRLMDAGRLDDARIHVDDLSELAHSALEDVRDVVAYNKTLFPSNELASAQRILDAASIDFTVIEEGAPPPGQPSTLVAFVIREGVTNALAHASPTEVRVYLRSDGVSIVNNGCATQRLPFSPWRRESDHGGSGLKGLRERVEPYGSLTWGMKDDHWHLDLHLSQIRAKEKKALPFLPWVKEKSDGEDDSCNCR